MDAQRELNENRQLLQSIETQESKQVTTNAVFKLHGDRRSFPSKKHKSCFKL